MEQEMQNGTPESLRHTPYTRMMMRLQLDRVQSEIERFKGMLQMLGETGEDLQNVMRYLDERMRDLNRLLREIIQQEQRKARRRTARLQPAQRVGRQELFVLHRRRYPAHERCRGALGAAAKESPVGTAQESRARPFQRQRDAA